MLSPFRRVMKRFHPEGIPWFGTVMYNAASATDVFQRHYELVAQDVLNYSSEGAVLDIGTGPGRLLQKLHQVSPDFQLTGVDISSSMVERARRNFQESGLVDQITLREGGASSLPFADEAFDTVISTGSIHHWKDPTAGLNEIYRVLKKGGCALLYDLVSDTPESVMQKAKEEFGRLRMFLLWLHAFDEPFYSCENFPLLIQPTHFQQVQTKFVGVMLCLILSK